MSDGFRVPHRTSVMVQKYNNGTPIDGEPDEIVEEITWHDAAGNVIDDLDQIAELERLVEES